MTPLRQVPTRISLLTGACLLLIATVILWVAAAHIQPNRCTATVAVHRVTTDCYTPEEIARRYGWQGDWRDYMAMVQQLNGWERWPMLHRGDDMLVLWYPRRRSPRTHQSASPQQGRPGRGDVPFTSAAQPSAAPGHRSDHQRNSAGPVPGRPD